MDNFPKFMKSAANRIATSSQSTQGVEGYVYDGMDGSQMAFWTCHDTAVSAPHVHDYDEYMVVVGLLHVGVRRTSRPDKDISSLKGFGMAARSWLAREPFTHSVGGGHRERSTWMLSLRESSAGKKVMQFLSEGRYVANVVDGKVTLYGGRADEGD
jgi:hypothetical protein